MISKEDINTLEEIIKWEIVNRPKIIVMENWMKKYIDKNIVICPSCSAQIRHAHQKIKDWYGNNQEEIQYVKNFKEPKRCSCGNELKDSRYKYCSLSCKKN
jgi:hypothetical protein